MPRVVVADDDRDIRELLITKISLAGYEVVAAEDGERALQAIQGQTIDLAVLDIAMPGLSGTELCELLRKDQATASLPIILLTAKARELEEHSGRTTGANVYLMKPFSPRELIVQIKTLLEDAAPTLGH